jgi:hypothetical protein
MLKKLAQAVDDTGFCLFGGFELTAAQRQDLPPHCASAKSLALTGNAGPAMWNRFAASPRHPPDPLDAWTRTQLTALAQAFGATAVFPFDRPYLPFQRWLMKAGPCHPSPLGIVIHPRYGLWHALRGALLFAGSIEFPPAEPVPSPCSACREKPCLSACPVHAFSERGYETGPCVAELAGNDAGNCMASGCLARRACPVGADYRYPPAQAAFHMRAFQDGFRAAKAG